LLWDWGEHVAGMVDHQLAIIKKIIILRRNYIGCVLSSVSWRSLVGVFALVVSLIHVDNGTTLSTILSFIQRLLPHIPLLGVRFEQYDHSW